MPGFPIRFFSAFPACPESSPPCPRLAGARALRPLSPAPFVRHRAAPEPEPEEI